MWSYPFGIIFFSLLFVLQRMKNGKNNDALSLWPIYLLLSTTIDDVILTSGLYPAIFSFIIGLKLHIHTPAIIYISTSFTRRKDFFVCLCKMIYFPFNSFWHGPKSGSWNVKFWMKWKWMRWISRRELIWKMIICTHAMCIVKCKMPHWK